MATAVTTSESTVTARATESAPLSSTALVAYSLPSLGTGAMMGLVLIYFLKFATDVLVSHLRWQRGMGVRA